MIQQTEPLSLTIPNPALPRGFRLTRSPDGYPQITYRMTDQRGLAFFWVVWLAGWAYVCVFKTWDTLIRGEFVNFEPLLCLIPFWAIGFVVLGYTARIFWLVNVFTFHPDRLVVEHAFWGYSRRREFPKQAIHAVRQVKDKNSEEQYPWGLVIEGGSTACCFPDSRGTRATGSARSSPSGPALSLSRQAQRPGERSHPQVVDHSGAAHTPRKPLWPSCMYPTNAVTPKTARFINRTSTLMGDRSWAAQKSPA